MGKWPFWNNPPKSPLKSISYVLLWILWAQLGGEGAAGGRPGTFCWVRVNKPTEDRDGWIMWATLKKQKTDNRNSNRERVKKQTKQKNSQGSQWLRHVTWALLRNRNWKKTGRETEITQGSFLKIFCYQRLNFGWQPSCPSCWFLLMCSIFLSAAAFSLWASNIWWIMIHWYI